MSEEVAAILASHLITGIPNGLPEMPTWDESVDHAPARRQVLTQPEKLLAIRNALRYFPKNLHAVLAKEFFEELDTFGRIIMWRYRPTEYEMKAYPIDYYPAKCKQAAAIMLMIQNNLDKRVAQFPHELITYGGNGAVFQNWAQYRIVMKYLSQMTEQQTLVMYSGHPLGLFPSSPSAPRVIVTNGMVIPNHSSPEDYERMNALGVSQYGQMTAGSYMYIGPQGIVHGTTITLLNAARVKLGLSGDEGLEGVTFVTSGLGGMSGAQAKAAVIAGASCIIAEVNPHAARKRQEQGWLSTIAENVDDAIDTMVLSAQNKESISIGYVGNIVTLWERLVERNINVDLGSDQTSLHNPWQGGYFPVGFDYESASRMMSENPQKFCDEVKNSLNRQATAINQLSDRGMYFWDYGNAFLLEASRAGADVMCDDGSFRYPSYVEDNMGPLCFDYGFGPYRWVCCSGNPQDLAESDAIACEVLSEMILESPDEIKQQMKDNIRWIEQAGSNKMVVGSQARILYADDEGRRRIASAMNKGQNTKMDPLEACKVIKKSGMGITAGFMLGVDGEKKTIFNQMYELIEDAGIPDPMVGLVAIGEGSDGVGTALYERLRREGRLKVKEETDGTNTHNFYLDFIPNGEMDEAEIVNGYKDLLGRLFLDEGNYYQRCKNNHDLITPNPHVGKSGFSLEKLATMGRFMKCLAPKWLGGDGAANSKSMEYLSWVIRNHRDQFPEAAAQVVRHQHFKDVTTAALDADAYAPKVESLYSQLVGKAGKIYDNCKDKGQEAIDRAKIKMAGIAEKVVRSAEKKYHKLHDSFREGAALNALINLRERIAGKEYLPAFAIAG